MSNTNPFNSHLEFFPALISSLITEDIWIKHDPAPSPADPSPSPSRCARSPTGSFPCHQNLRTHSPIPWWSDWRLPLFLGCPQLIPHISEIPDHVDIP
ncbi:hypothetical protein EK904_015207 [Melospiza melodia maxima]|nr:hypothetical protein EK904_015207 [Melospiza melodia maxima]